MTRSTLRRRIAPAAVACATTLVLAACGGQSEEPAGGGDGGGGELSGQVLIDGSSTVAPLSQAAAEFYAEEEPGVNVTVANSGTGGGFDKFCAGENDISDASRPIEPDEVKACKKGGVEFTELQVANDGIAVVSNKRLAIDCMTTDQLEQLWATNEVENYSEIDPKFADKKVSLFGPGTDAGRFDFLTDEINGEEGRTRKDYQPSEDDNVLVQGVEGDEGGLGYFGFSYYEQNADKLNLVGVDAGDGCVKPSTEAIQAGKYKPLARPLFMYPSDKSLKKPAVKAFMDFVAENHEKIATASQIVPMSPDQATKAKAALGGGA